MTWSASRPRSGGGRADLLGRHRHGDYFYWRKSGPDPDRWPVVVSSRLGYWWEREGGFLSMIVGLIDGSVVHDGLPPDPGPNPRIELVVRATDNQE